MGAMQSQVFTSHGTFNVPAGVSVIHKSGIAGGAGGDPWPGAAGGSGCFVYRIPIHVTPFDAVSIIVGAAGIGAPSNTPGGATAGGNTTVGPITLGGGKQPTSVPVNTSSGIGGGANGGSHAEANVNGFQPGTQLGACNILGTAPNCYGGGGGPIWGGGSGGGQGGAGNLNGNTGANSVNGNPGGASGGPYGSGCAAGAGGASSPWGGGGKGGNANTGGIGLSASGNGAGGGGGTCNGDIGHIADGGPGGDGTGGLVWIEWIGPP